MVTLDALIVAFDRGLRTLAAPAQSGRPVPGASQPEAQLNDREKREAAALMRVNHAGEVCAQALYQGQSLTARNPEVQAALASAAAEETEHLAWCEHRLAALGSHKSFLNPVWYTGSFAIGAFAGLMGDRWNLGFLAETERQVERHLDSHLSRLPPADQRSRAVVEQMKSDESRHATTAVEHGAAVLPLPVQLAMRLASRLMTRTAYWV